MCCRRIGGWLVAAVVVVIMFPAEVHAAPYPVEPPPSSVSDGVVPPGGAVTFSGSGFLPFEKISINIDYSGSDSSAAFRWSIGGGFTPARAQLLRRARLTVTADAHGAFSITLRLTQIGNAVLTATGVTSGRTVTANVKVLAPSDGDDKKPTTPGDKKPTTPGNKKPTTPGDDKPTNPRDNDRTIRPGDGTALPTTGSGGVPLLIAVASGVGLVSFGAAILFVIRGRRRRTAVDR